MTCKYIYHYLSKIKINWNNIKSWIDGKKRTRISTKEFGTCRFFFLHAVFFGSYHDLKSTNSSKEISGSPKIWLCEFLCFFNTELRVDVYDTIIKRLNSIRSISNKLDFYSYWKYCDLYNVNYINHASI